MVQTCAGTITCPDSKTTISSNELSIINMSQASTLLDSHGGSNAQPSPQVSPHASLRASTRTSPSPSPHASPRIPPHASPHASAHPSPVRDGPADDLEE